jgi:hypothetical protein
VALALLVAGCGDDDDPGTSADTSAAVMAASLLELITVDHTFGAGPAPFTEYLILERTDPAAGAGAATTEARPLTQGERSAIEAAVTPQGPVRWIADQSDWITEELTPTIPGAAILGVGAPVIEGDTALVPVSLWCGGLCAAWHSYRLDFSDGTWRVRGIEGPRAVS